MAAIAGTFIGFLKGIYEISFNKNTLNLVKSQ